MAQTGIEVPHLRTWRQVRVLTQRELAEKAGMQPAIVSRVERGSRASMKTVRQLAKALGISPTRLVSGELGDSK